MRVRRGRQGAWAGDDGYVIAKGVKTTGGARAGAVILRVVCGQCSAVVGEVRQAEQWPSLQVVSQGPITTELSTAVAEVRRGTKRAASPQPRWHWTGLDAQHRYGFCCRAHGVGQLDGEEILTAVEKRWRSVAMALC